MLKRYLKSGREKQNRVTGYPLVLLGVILTITLCLCVAVNNRKSDETNADEEKSALTPLLGHDKGGSAGSDSANAGPEGNVNGSSAGIAEAEDGTGSGKANSIGAEAKDGAGIAGAETEGSAGAKDSTDDGSTDDIDIEEPILPETELPALHISEAMSSNTAIDKHHGGYYDMVELYNSGAEQVLLSDYYLSDGKKHLNDYRLPEVLLEPGQYYTLYCTGKYEAESEEDLEFKLSYFGEKLYLADSEGNIADMLELPELPSNISIGRNQDGRIEYYDKPSFGGSNPDGYYGITPKPVFGEEPGFYCDAVKLELCGEGDIYYTLDGTVPDRNAIRWNGEPIDIAATTTVRMVACMDSSLQSFETSGTFFIGEPEYELDVAMLTLSAEDMDRMRINYDSNRKYRAALSLYSDGKQQFDIPCSVNVFGCTSRAYDKKSYQIKFSAAYGPTKLKYRLFDSLAEDEFDALVLRSGSQDNQGALMRDELVSAAAVAKGIVSEVVVQAYRPVNLYINNEYAGIYYIREHIDEDMLASRYSCDPEQITLIEQMDTAKCGKDAAEWFGLWEYLRKNRLTDKEKYEYVSSLVSLESVADYYIIQMWCANRDMDNVRVFKAADGKWRFILYDLDLVLNRSVAGSVKYTVGKTNFGAYTYNALICRLLENEEFFAYFCERMKIILENVLDDADVTGQIQSLADRLRNDMKYNCELWGTHNDSSGKISYRNYSGWENSVKALEENVLGRCSGLIADFSKYYKDKEAVVGIFFEQ